MTGVELDVLCEEWLEAKFANYRKFYSPYYWLLSGNYPMVFQRVMRQLQIDWHDNIGDTTADQIDLEEARIALGLAHTPVPDCFDKAFADGELAP